MRRSGNQLKVLPIQKSIFKSSMKSVFFSLGLLGSLASIYAISGIFPALYITLFVFLSGGVFQFLKMSRRIREIESQIALELPGFHKFLGEFLRTTYIARGEEIIVARNRGLAIISYDNNFQVRGSDCSNSQTIIGRNVSTQPVRGMSFALVGGSSMNKDDLKSSYKTHDGAAGSPEFLIDDDRFKIAFCQFKTPLAYHDQFTLNYSDNWKGAMREKADGFFFPEALYFPEKIAKLSVLLEFDMKINILASLEIDMVQGTARHCDEQPVAVSCSPGFLSAFRWEKFNPSPQTIYLLYYSSS